METAKGSCKRVSRRIRLIRLEEIASSRRLDPKFDFGGERIKTDVRSDEKPMNRDGRTYQRAPYQLLEPLTRNAPPTGETHGWTAPTSAEGSEGSRTQAPGLNRQEDAVNELVKPSDRSDRDGSRHQGDLTPKLEFGGEMIETEVRKDEKWENGEGRTYQRPPNQLLEPLTRNTPPTGKTDGWRATTSAESSDGSTTQGPGLKRQEDTVNGSASASVPSDRGRSRHQGDFTPNFEFGGEIIKTDVRADENQTDRDGHTSQRVQNQLLDPLTRNVPPTGEMNDLRGQFCGQNGYLRCNDLETCKDSCKRTIKGGKGQPKANGTEDLPSQSKRTATRATALTAATDKLQRSQVTKIPRHNAARRDSPHTAMHSTVATSGPWPYLIYIFARPSAHLLGGTSNPSDHSAIKTDNPPTASTTNLTATKADTATCTLPLTKHGWHCHMREFCNGLKHHTLSGCIIPFVFFVIGMQTYTILFY